VSRDRLLSALVPALCLACAPPPSPSYPYGGTVQFRELVPPGSGPTFRIDVALAASVAGSAAFPTGCSFSSAPVAVTGVSAGNVSLGDGDVALASMPFDAAHNSYPSVTSGPLLNWKPGDTLQADGDGAVVTTFDGVVNAPSHLVSVMPAALNGASTAHIPLGQDLTVTWAAGAGQLVSLQLADTSSKASVTCTGPDSGQLVLPHSILSMMVKSTHVTATLARVNMLKGTSSNADIGIVATSELHTAVSLE